MSPEQCGGHAVLSVTTKEWTRRKWDGFSSPVSSNLPLLSLRRARSDNKFLTWWNTSVFSSQHGFDQSNYRTTLHPQVRWVRKVTGIPPPWAPGADPNTRVLSFGWAELSAPCMCSYQTVWICHLWVTSLPMAGQVWEWAEGDCHGSAWAFITAVPAQVSSKSTAAASPALSVLPCLPPRLLCLCWGSSTFLKGKGAANHKPHWRDPNGSARTAQVFPQCKNQSLSTDQQGSKAITASTPPFSNTTWGIQERIELVFHNLCMWGHTNLCQTGRFLPVTWPLMIPVLKLSLQLGRRCPFHLPSGCLYILAVIEGIMYMKFASFTGIHF